MPRSPAAFQATEAMALQLDHDVAAFDLYRIDGNFRTGILRGFAGLRVPLPSVPGADDLVVFDDALSQGAPPVQAHIVDCRDGPVYVGYADHTIPAGEFFRLSSGGEF
jgi:hypothetical protein